MLDVFQEGMLFGCGAGGRLHKRLRAWRKGAFGKVDCAQPSRSSVYLPSLLGYGCHACRSAHVVTDAEQNGSDSGILIPSSALLLGPELVFDKSEE